MHGAKMFFWIYDIPNWQVALLFATVFIGFTWVGLLLARPTVRRWVGPQPGVNDLISYVLSSYCVFYGLMLGLVAVGTTQNFAEIEKTVGQEAAALAGLYRDISSYPEPIRGELQSSLRDYCRYVIDKAWPDQRRGVVPEGGSEKLAAFQAKLLAFQPSSKAQEILHAETLRQFSVCMERTRLRLQSVTAGLPGILWFVVVIGAVLNIFLTWLFSIDKLIIHLFLSGILSLFISLVISLIAAMDYPFRGELSVSADPFESTYTHVMAAASHSALIWRPANPFAFRDRRWQEPPAVFRRAAPP